MHILHLLSNSKWTERAEPVADLAVAQRTLGCAIDFACGRLRPGQPPDRAAEPRARQKGLEPVGLELDKHLDPRSMVRDIPRLRALLVERRIEVVHAHMENAHLLAALAVRGRRARPLVVRSSYEPDGPPGGWRPRLLHRYGTDGLVLISEGARRAALARFRFPAERMAVIEPGIDLGVFDPARPLEQGDRASFGLADGQFVLGVLSRLRADRRVDLIIRAALTVARRYPHFRLLICGHGEGEPELRRLVRELGAEGWVLFAGYCRGDRLPAAFRAMDALAYPAPGTDQSCRTVREALASGTPVLAARTGFLPELIDEGATGFVLDLEEAAWTAAVERLCARPDQLPALRAACLATARRRFALALQAERTLAFYRTLRPR